MKKVIILFLILSVLLCGCRHASAENPVSSEPAAAYTNPVPSEAATEMLPPELDAFRQVLEGRIPIVRAASQESIPISRISLFFTIEELPWEVVRFAVQDLDDDGILDAVLEVSDNMGYVILHYQEDGSVSGREIWHRAFQELKTDGSYRGSGSSFNRSYRKMHSVADILLAECYEQDVGDPVYWINGENVDVETFAAFEEAQAAKPNTLWYESWEHFLNLQK